MAVSWAAHWAAWKVASLAGSMVEQRAFRKVWLTAELMVGSMAEKRAAL
jgi:hypothetical protein